MTVKLSNTYKSLGDNFSQAIVPVPVASPRLLLWNQALAEQILFDESLTADTSALAQMFSGNRLLPNSEPVAMAYAGHQFGQFVPQLGDGRAHLLGELIDRDGRRLDIQLKGSGPTGFSRGGDGRCALGPALREFIMSEAMAALGVPTTRALAVVATGETVYRQSPAQGAVVTRVAASHLRVGTFQYFAARGDREALQTLADYTIERHYPQLVQTSEFSQAEGERYLALLDNVIERQIQLVVHWMRVGFIHGVMNTDNTALSGETIDYGPCAMLSHYDPRTVYSSIDVQGRYAFGSQPAIAQWNMARFAECLLDLVDSDQQRAVERLTPLINEFPQRYQRAFNKMMAGKLGLATLQQGDEQLITELLELLERQRLDYTVTFHRLTEGDGQLRDTLADWYPRWQQRLATQASTAAQVQTLMRSHNPVVIPRNHHVEAVLRACEQTGEATAAEDFLRVLRSPYRELPETAHYQDPPADGDLSYQTFCGT